MTKVKFGCLIGSLLILIGILSLWAVILILNERHFVRRPIFRNAAAVEAVQLFNAAQDLSPNDRANRESNELNGWKHPLQLQGGRLLIEGHKYFSTITVTYDDTRAQRTTSDYRDYTTNLAIRVAADRLYVYRGISLMWTEYRLAVFDLNKGEPIADYLVDPKDVRVEP